MLISLAPHSSSRRPPAGLFAEEYQTSCSLSFFPIRGSGLHYCRPAGCEASNTQRQKDGQTDRQADIKVQALKLISYHLCWRLKHINHGVLCSVRPSVCLSPWCVYAACWMEALFWKSHHTYISADLTVEPFVCQECHSSKFSERAAGFDEDLMKWLLKLREIHTVFKISQCVSFGQSVSGWGSRGRWQNENKSWEHKHISAWVTTPMILHWLGLLFRLWDSWWQKSHTASLKE